jgi:hypothetical protein
MTAIQDFSIPLGDDLDVVFSLDPADNISLTGAMVNWQAYEMVFAVPDVTQQVAAKDSGTGGVTIDDATGQFVVHLAAADTALLSCGNYYFEAEIVDASGNHATVCQGAMAVTMAMIQ